jgi:hypothetical protein
MGFQTPQLHIFFMKKIHFTIFKDYLMNETDPRVKYGDWGNGEILELRHHC